MLKRMLVYTRFEITRTLRNVRFLVFAIGVPTVFYLLFNSIYGRSSVDVGAYVLVSMAGYSAIGSAMYNAATLPGERASGWIRQLRITPLSGSAWLRAKVLQSLVVVLPGLIAVSVCSVMVGHVRMGAQAWATLAAIVLGGSISFSFLGLLIGHLVDVQVAQPAQAVVQMLMGFGGGLFFPLSSMPAAVQAIGKTLPSYRMFQLGQEAVVGQALSMDYLTGLAGTIVALGALVLLAWRWRETAQAVAA